MFKLPLKYILPAIFACLLWSTAFVGVKIGLQYSTPLFFAGIRFVISGLLILPFAGPFLEILQSVRQHYRVIIKVALLQTVIVYTLFYTGMTLIAGSLAAIIIGASPLISAIVAHYTMHDDRMTVFKTISLLIGMTGVIIIALSRQPWQAAGLREFIGVLILVLSSFSGAFANVTVARDSQTLPPLVLTSVQIFIGGVILLVISVLVEGVPVFNYPPAYYSALLWLSMVSAVGFSIWFSLLKKPGVKVSSLNLWKFIIPVFGALIAWIILPDEQPEPWAIMGMVFVAFSILSFNLCSLFSKRCD